MNKAMSAQSILALAIAELSNLEKSEPFTVKDLFKGYLWNKQPLTARLLCSSLFINYAEQSENKIQRLGKNAIGHQQYQKL